MRKVVVLLLLVLITSTGAAALAAAPVRPVPVAALARPSQHFYNVAATHSPRLERMLAGAGSDARADSPAANPTPPPPGTVLGVDVASGQHAGGATIDWAKVATAGYRFAFIKTTEGSYYVNPFFAPDFAAARAAGLLVAAYHFANPSFSGGALQADFAVDHAGVGDDGVTLPIIADMEFDPYAAADHTNECYGLTPAQMVSWIRSFSAEIRRRTGQRPVIYTAASWWGKCTGRATAFAADPLWVASYNPGSTTGPTMPAGWPTWAYWQ
ncbi:MAG TPA: GH25 family lysozyme [Streptosporangiaceae bacterium]|nr:GH25 family lysozyme [Streptosporangiaceae bacterium]